jgi:hypothetical protein
MVESMHFDERGQHGNELGLSKPIYQQHPRSGG